MKNIHTTHHHKNFLDEFSGVLEFGEQRNIFFSEEKLGGSEKFKKREKKTVGQEAIETHEKAEKSKKRVEKSPLRKFIDKNPDSEIAAADSDRSDAISNQIQNEPHAVVASLMADNIPAEAGEKIAKSLMNNYV